MPIKGFYFIRYKMKLLFFSVVSYTSSSGEVVVAGVSLSRRNYTEDRTILPHALYELDFVQGMRGIFELYTHYVITKLNWITS